NHKLISFQAGISFRCDCGHESRSHGHDLCEIANFTVIRDNIPAMGEDAVGITEGGAAAAAVAAVAAVAADLTAPAYLRIPGSRSTGRKCDNCDMTFSHFRAYKSHVLTLCGTRCGECLMVFKSQMAMAQHRKLQHSTAAAAAPIAAAKFVCEECGVRSTTAGNLKKHMLTHGGE
ncbi:hypothetical protein PFISCL1PPCAC_12230, partial [Pristionchus fissidentatus]